MQIALYCGTCDENDLSDVDAGKHSDKGHEVFVVPAND